MTGDRPGNPALEAARELERKGQVDPAVRAYLRAGSIADAARVLAGVKRYADAGHLVMDALGIGPALVAGLDPDKKKLVGKAAVCFAQAGDAKRAVELFLALGDPARAAEAAERAGDPAEAARIRARGEKKSEVGAPGSEMGRAAERAAAAKLEQAGQYEPALNEYVRIKAPADAGRVAYKLKRFAVAAAHFEDAGMVFEAAACFAEAGEKRRCLDAVLRVPRDHPKYRIAAAQAIRVASELDPLDRKLDPFVAPFVEGGPKDDREAEALYALATLYRRRDLPDSAREVYAKLLAARPGYRDVEDRIAKLSGDGRSSRLSLDSFALGGAPSQPDSRLRGAAPPPPEAGPKVKADSFPDLPDLPPPPAAPAPPPKTSYGLSTPSGRFAAVNVPRRTSIAGMPRVTGPLGPASAASPASAQVATGSPIASGELGLGATVADRYRIEAKIGQGGMAVVYRATDLELGEEIAIKLFLQPSDDPQLLARFKQELTLSRGFAHPNIVRLYDIGQHQGCRFLTMELLQGSDLASLIDGKPMELARGLRYLIQAAAGMAVAHDKGVVHRDVKPANFFVTKDDTLKVMDFGIAKRQSGQPGLTQAGFIAGTPTYMSPEQINNFTAVTHLTDMYALGVVAYEVFTGTVPFDHAEMMQLLMMHLTRAPDPPRMRNPELPEELQVIILKLLEKDPEGRIQTCHELGDQLKALLAQVKRD
jgi:tetratricopeptide (TPR) repeat protein